VFGPSSALGLPLGKQPRTLSAGRPVGRAGGVCPVPARLGPCTACTGSWIGTRRWPGAAATPRPGRPPQGPA